MHKVFYRVFSSFFCERVFLAFSCSFFGPFRGSNSSRFVPPRPRCLPWSCSRSWVSRRPLEPLEPHLSEGILELFFNIICKTVERRPNWYTDRRLYSRGCNIFERQILTVGRIGWLHGPLSFLRRSSSHAPRGNNVPQECAAAVKWNVCTPWSNRSNGVMLNVHTLADESAGKASTVTIEIRVDSSVSLVCHWCVTGV